MNARHTPGPWAVSKIGNNYDQYMVYAEGAPNGRNVASSIDGEANARLIAAAPELLDALQAFVRDRATCPTTNGKDLAAWEKMKRVIAEARRRLKRADRHALRSAGALQSSRLTNRR